MTDQMNVSSVNNKFAAGFNNFVNGFSTGENDFKAVLKKTPLRSEEHTSELQSRE